MTTRLTRCCLELRVMAFGDFGEGQGSGQVVWGSVPEFSVKRLGFGTGTALLELVLSLW